MAGQCLFEGAIAIVVGHLGLILARYTMNNTGDRLLHMNIINILQYPPI